MSLCFVSARFNRHYRNFWIVDARELRNVPKTEVLADYGIATYYGANSVHMSEV